MTTPTANTDTISYEQAQQELDSIIESFNNKPSMDAMLAGLTRAKELEAIIRERITAIEQVVKETFSSFS